LSAFNSVGAQVSPILPKVLPVVSKVLP
jgi:hypothetical protein